MKIRSFLAGLAAVALLGLGIRAIADDATTNPSEAEPNAAPHGHIVAPFNLLPDLTDDQKSKIHDIHAEYLDQEKQLKQKQYDDIDAILTDDQKKELDDLMSKDAVEKKAEEIEKRAQSEEEKAQQLKQQLGGGASTQPSGGN